ncbi:VWA domain-containing protein [Ornithinibacillus scapharcae]|uniref:VWA domain-containing protein n=1 Tax=Ornithinibacillus scapharcae TaxID=1147159 RepID=UPI000225B3FD|nr:VWA domain-containing protein [Ornithinibacillus scapharcae]
MQNTRLIIFMIILTIILFGCKKENENNDNTQNDSDSVVLEEDTKGSRVEKDADIKETDVLEEEVLKLLEELPEVPTDVGGIINQLEGPFTTNKPDWDDQEIEAIREELNKLPPLPKDASEELVDQYFQYFYWLVAEDFPDPQDTIKKWEFSSFGNPDLPDSRFHFKENYNVEVLLDGSGSMGAYIGDKTMMQIAKESIKDFLEQVPEEANVSLRVYGHKGTGSNSDKKLSCSAIEQVYGYQTYDEGTFQQQLDKIEPAGWTPLADALLQAKDSLKEFDAEHHTNLIYVVSDGIETCDGDPVQVAKSLSDSNAKPIINIIGFNVDSDAQKQLKEMAKVSGGIFSTVNDQEELEEEFKRAEKVLEEWEEWKEDAINDADYQKVRNSFDILEVTNEWNRRDDSQYVSIYRLVYIAEEEGILTINQMDKFHSKNNEMQDLIKRAKREIEEDLNQISAEKIGEMKETIQDKYDNSINE